MRLAWEGRGYCLQAPLRGWVSRGVAACQCGEEQGAGRKCTLGLLPERPLYATPAPALPCTTLQHHVLPRPTPPCPALPYQPPPCPALQCLVCHVALLRLARPAPRRLAPPCPRHVLPCPAPPRPVSFCPVLVYPVLVYPVLVYPVLYPLCSTLPPPPLP